MARECNWATVAAQYAGFLEAVVQGKEWARGARGFLRAEASAQRGEPRLPLEPAVEYLRGWAASEASAGYLNTHQTRLLKTLEITPPGGPDDRVLEMGAYLQITPALRTQARLRRGARLLLRASWAASTIARVTSAEGETFECEIDHFDAEKDVFPYPDAHFATVICGELIEHLFEDPMHLMSEVNRILKPGGHLVLTTPNIAALRGIAAILQGYHPGFFHAYIRPAEGTGEVDARHNREYTPREIHQLLENSGFEVTLLETGEFRDEPHPEFGWMSAPAGALPPEHRTARRRHLRGGPQDGRGARALSRVALHMSAAYLEPDVKLDAGTRTLHAAFAIRNDSPEPWRPSEGFGVGYHLFDADTGTLIVDGARVHPEHDVKPGETAQVRLEIPLPAEDGRYQVLLSPMREDVCWYYEQGWPFLLVETATENGAARVDRVRVADAGDARARARGARHRAGLRLSAIDDLAQSRPDPRDGAARHSGPLSRESFGGAFWTIINPLLLMLTYFFVFGVVLRDRYDPHATLVGASRSTSWRACCRGWPSARPPGGPPA